MSFLLDEDDAAEAAGSDSEQTLEAALSFLADCEQSASWLLAGERHHDRSGSTGAGTSDEDAQATALLGVDGFDFFSPSDGSAALTTLATSDDSPDNSRSGAADRALLTGSSSNTHKSRKHSNRARDERRQELVYLRKKVREMEAQLEELKQQPKAKRLRPETPPKRSSAPASVSSSTSTSPTSSSASSQSSDALAAVWGDMAKRQLLERQQAERENVRLKLILERQLKMARSLEKILKNRHNNQSAESLGLNSKRIRHLSPSGDRFEDNRAILDMLLSGVEQARREVDAVFEANGLGRMETPHRNAKVEHDGTNGIVMEIYANKVMPFDVHTTGRAVWRHFAHAKYNVPQQTYYEKQPMYIETDGDTFVESYGLEQREGHIKANFHVKHILRRYIEDDRIIIVWCTVTDTVEFRSEPTTGIRFLEKGYIVIQRPNSSTLPNHCSLLKTCYIIRPDAYGDMPDQAQKIGALTDFALSSVSGTISTSHQMIENFLLSESLKK